MAASPVFFAPPDHLEASIPRLLVASGFTRYLDRNKTLAIKVHFGEQGRPTYLRPSLVRAATKALGSCARNCLLVETTTLYRSVRSTAKGHTELARRHGFTRAKTGCDISIIDGNKGEAFYEVPIGLKHTTKAKLGAGLESIHQLLNMAHFKGHMVTGFGGALKNLAMGLAAKAGKLEMHSRSRPQVRKDRCTACGECAKYCPSHAIEIAAKVAVVRDNCLGCAGCLAVCPNGAIDIKWDEATPTVGAKVVEYAAAALQGRVMLHMNFAIDITPNCDCIGRDEKPVMPDVGVFVSTDPVACEQAAFDRVWPKLGRHWPNLNPEQQLTYAARLGLGSREYEIVEV